MDYRKELNLKRQIYLKGLIVIALFRWIVESAIKICKNLEFIIVFPVGIKNKIIFLISS